MKVGGFFFLISIELLHHLINTDEKNPFIKGAVSILFLMFDRHDLLDRGCLILCKRFERVVAYKRFNLIEAYRLKLSVIH